MCTFERSVARGGRLPDQLCAPCGATVHGAGVTRAPTGGAARAVLSRRDMGECPAWSGAAGDTRHDPDCCPRPELRDKPDPAESCEPGVLDGPAADAAAPYAADDYEPPRRWQAAARSRPRDERRRVLRLATEKLAAIEEKRGRLLEADVQEMFSDIYHPPAPALIGPLDEDDELPAKRDGGESPTKRPRLGWENADPNAAPQEQVRFGDEPPLGCAAAAGFADFQHVFHHLVPSLES
ncbi:uncharacterized protein LOC119099629 [Pollicipes pollicipes]|uniref:uncharacterized protein LOC119099629 n=1 Tax=Pollicipes pollicipes TaxID=41117 RepID=UPI0018857DB1|nr:uncharacterized protein LOC119099629 [Pollicipes pollicipes]